jgi:signal transduction histidine kinase
MRPRRPPHGLGLKAPGLRALLSALALGTLALPLALGLFVASLISGGINEEPIARFVVVNQEISRAVGLDEAGVLVAKPGYRAPDWLHLIITDLDALVVYSNVAGIAPGSRPEPSWSNLLPSPTGPFALPAMEARPPAAGLPGGAGAGGAAASGAASGAGAASAATCLYADTLVVAGRVRGNYFALVPPLDLVGRQRRHNFGLQFLFLGILTVMAILLGAGVSALLARAVMRLERAAGNIAGGDLDTAVQVRGVREIGALAQAMDRMRATLREERDRRARFLAAVSHDLRTPLTSIGGYLEAVEDGLAAEPETLARYVGIMHAKTRLLENRIQGLLEFARMETGEWRSGFERLDLGPFLEELAREFREDAGLVGKSLVADLSAAAPLVVAADPVLLRRAFENLISNALRHSPAGGRVELRAQRQGRLLRIEIDDEGPGVPEADRERIFEPFFRGSGAREGEGNGLGLYIARSVLQGHGWSLVATATPTGGARFTVGLELPEGR